MMPLSAQELAVMLELPDEVMYETARAVYGTLAPVLDAFDDVYHKAVPETAEAIDGYFAAHKHAMSQRLPLMTPSHVLFTTCSYFVLLLLAYLVGRLLGKMQLRLVGLLNNFFLFALSLYMMVSIIVTAISNNFSLWNNPVGEGPGHWRMAKLLWLFYISKIPEFADTFIMIFKQNYRQVSFLHLYHHSTIFVIWFIVVCEGPGGEAYFSAMVNSGIHVIMYGYYFGTALFPSGPVRKFLNSIKFFITYGQMTQFAVNCMQSAYDLYGCTPSGYPVHLIQLLFFYMLTLLALFGNFLVQNQGKSNEKQKKN